MEFNWSKIDLDFRADLSDFLDIELEENWLDPARILGSQANAEYSKKFAGLLAQRGWLTPHWPKEHSGQNTGPWQLAILGEEMWSRGEPRGPQYMNVNWIGPSIMIHGNEEQIARFLPPIREGNVIWCQGFSEPDAGTDLSSLRTGAEIDGDEYIVNGSKIWTSYADIADYCFLLVRTGTTKGNRGISILLVDMNSPGIEVRKIRGIVGEHSFNEIFFSNVRVPIANRLGDEDEGWTVVREALVYERVGAPRWARARFILEEAMQWAIKNNRANDPTILEYVGNAQSACEAARMLCYRVFDERAKNLPPSSHANLARVAMIQAERLVAEACIQLQQSQAFCYTSLANQQMRKSMAAGVAAGTYEVQLNLISSLFLKLPKG